ncbi:unnamed protein product [Zymoseptoria tritici ST99CH_1A5]|uniref:HCNGP-like protein n=2 Tax=Zymoseptoria tritici TaxID=1047171 RepID=A0A2H1GPF7_ZYMTR|nr:unnamed protein product [Zymoseptoria tritici ST99CH_1E4]SMR57824.1 unnamed protein product [Zymoseptoria tritici ST99CH_3D1]SMY26259.1 unnamed protein product [Zymoseptoria tritici ST99CH_1A5]
MALIDYGSSDDEDDIQPEKPSKIAKIEATAPPAEEGTSEPQRPQPSVQDEKPVSLDTSGPAPGPSIPTQDTSAEFEGDTTPSSPYTYERNRLRELTMPTMPNFDIPDSPPPPPVNSEEAAVLAATTKKIERFLELKKKGVHFNERLQNSTSLRNPSLLPKLMQFADITREDSYRSSLPEGLGISVTWPEECYVEGLLRQNERKQKKKLAERDKVDFVPAVAKDEAKAQVQSAASEAGSGKKSRFDK